MQQLDNETILMVSPLACARELLEVMPLIMQTLHTSMRNCHKRELSVAQFRVLIFIKGHPEASISDVAEFCGLTLPSMSKLIDVLVERQLLTRIQHPTDRRRVQLNVTPEGLSLLNQTHQVAQLCLAKVLEQCTDSQRKSILEALHILRPVFQPEARATSCTKVNQPIQGNENQERGIS